MNTRLLGATTLVLALGGCASFTPDAGLGPATRIAQAMALPESWFCGEAGRNSN